MDNYTTTILDMYWQDHDNGLDMLHVYYARHHTHGCDMLHVFMIASWLGVRQRLNPILSRWKFHGVVHGVIEGTCARLRLSRENLFYFILFRVKSIPGICLIYNG